MLFRFMKTSVSNRHMFYIQVTKVMQIGEKYANKRKIEES